MICIEDIGNVLPSPTSGKIVGIASHRGDYIIVACEYGLYRLWDDGIETKAVKVEPQPDAARTGACGET